MRIIYFGTPEFAVRPLSRLLEAGYEIPAVVTQPDRQSGRGRKMNPAPVKVEAQKAGLKVLQPRRVREKDFIDELKRLDPRVIVVAAYGQILPKEIIQMPALGCINIHASLLPKYRGAAPINWAIINGEDKTGITTMLMDEGMDTGPVLLKKEINITPEDTAGSLSQRLSSVGADLITQTLLGLEDGSLKPSQQSGEATYAPILRKTDGQIKWSRSAYELCDFIRGMNPWPGAYTYLEGERLKILRAEPVDRDGEAGKISEVSRDKCIVGAGSGSVSILEIQPPGKPVMTAKAFLQGRKLRQEMRFDL